MKNKITSPVLINPLTAQAEDGKSLMVKMAALVDNGKKRARKQEVDVLLSNPQLTLWQDVIRGIPNEFVRSSLFTARNRKQSRTYFKQQVINVVGDGKITYTGEELRQDDQTVWLQLIHLARGIRLDATFNFTPRSFCNAIGWKPTGQSYERLERSMTRLQATSLKISSKRLGSELSISMLPGFQSKRGKDGAEAGLWTVRMHEELVVLFADFAYTKLEWEKRLNLPEGVATWLHAYYASHKEPYAVKIQTLAKGAGLIDTALEDIPKDDTERIAIFKERMREIKKLVINALEALKEAGFLVSYEVTKEGLVKVTRSKLEDSSAAR